MVEFFWSGQARKNKAASGKEKLGREMTFTGTLIEGLMATVERAEFRAYSDEPLFAARMEIEPWLVSTQGNAEYDSKFLGVA